MWRKFLTIATIVSLVLSVVVGVLWVRCFFVSDLVRFHAGGRSFAIHSDTRGLNFTTMSRPFAAALWERRAPFRGSTFWANLRPWHEAYGNAHSYAWLGFIVHSPRYRPPFFDDPGSWHTTAGVPFYALFVAASVLPACRLRTALRRRTRVRRGQCVDCGYDIRATPDQCPECGVNSRDPGVASQKSF